MNSKEFKIKLDKACKDNPDLKRSFIKKILKAKEDKRFRVKLRRQLDEARASMGPLDMGDENED